MGKPRSKLPSLASRNTVTCIDASDASRNLSVSHLHTPVLPCLATSSIERSIGQQQQPSPSTTVTDNATDVYRTSTPRRYEDWLLVKNHLIYISDEDTLDNAMLRQQEEHFVTLHYNFTYEKVTPRWTNVPPVTDNVSTPDTHDLDPKIHSTFDFESYFAAYSYEDMDEEDYSDVPADYEVHTIQHEDYPDEQTATVYVLPEALQSHVSAVLTDVSKTNESEIEPIDLTMSICCGYLGSYSAYVQPGGAELLQLRILHEGLKMGNNHHLDVSIEVPYNYRKRRRR